MLPTTKPQPLIGAHEPFIQVYPKNMSHIPKSRPDMSMQGFAHTPGLQEETPPKLVASHEFPYVTPLHPQTGSQTVRQPTSRLIREESTQGCENIKEEPIIERIAVRIIACLFMVVRFLRM